MGVVVPATRMRALALALVLLALPTAGCLSARDAARAPDGPTGPSVGTPEESRPPSVVRVDPNAPTVGTSHVHDYWLGLREYKVFDAALPPGEGGFCVSAAMRDACANGDASSNHVRLATDPDAARPAMVWPGTGKVTVSTAIDGQLLQPFNVVVTTPHRPYTTARITDRVQSMSVDHVLENQTDDPHRRSSDWTFNLEAATILGNGGAGARDAAPDGAVTAQTPGKATFFTGTLHLTITIYRSDCALPMDPAHPDLWAGATRHHMGDGTSAGNDLVVRPTDPPRWFTFPSGGAVLPLSARILFDLAWTNSVPGQAPPALVVCHPGRVCDDEFDRVPLASSADGHRQYAIDPRPDEWDSPYANATAWQFGWVFDHGDLGPAADQAGNTGVLTGTVSVAVDLVKTA